MIPSAIIKVSSFDWFLGVQMTAESTGNSAEKPKTTGCNEVDSHPASSSDVIVTQSPSTLFELRSSNPSLSFHFKTQSGTLSANSHENKINEDTELNQQQLEQDKMMYDAYLQTKENSCQRHFEQGCSLDKQFLWLASACIGLPIAYLGQSNINISSQYLYCSLIAAWIFLMLCIYFVLKGMILGNAAFNHDINCLEEQYKCYSNKMAYNIPENKFKERSRFYTEYARVFLIIGGCLLITFFALDIFSRVNIGKTTKPSDTQGESHKTTTVLGENND